jgi:hypothetical protein
LFSLSRVSAAYQQSLNFPVGQERCEPIFPDIRTSTNRKLEFDGAPNQGSTNSILCIERFPVLGKPTVFFKYPRNAYQQNLRAKIHAVTAFEST